MWGGMAKDSNTVRNLFFVGISLKLFWFLLLARFFNWRIHVLDNSSRPFQFKMLQKMHKRQWITRITEQHHAFYNSHSVAIELADRIVNQSSDSAVIQLARGLYKSKETDLVFKKTIAKHLSLLTSINQYILNKQKIIDPTLFISERYRKILQGNPEILDASITVKYGLHWEGVKLKAIWLAMVLGYLLHLLVQPFCKKSTDDKIFKYAISIPFSWATKFKGAREFTFLVDDNIIKKNETVFLVEYPESKKFYQHYSSAGYNLREATKIQQVKNLFSVSNLDASHDASKIVGLLMAHKEDFFIYEALIFLLISRISWSVITTKTLFKNYVYFNKEGKAQIAANIFLKEKYIVVHAYSQFIGGSYQVCGNSSVFDNRNVHWSFLNPDYFYLNNQAMVDSMALHCQKSVKHKAIGNIFSEKIIEIRGNVHYIEKLRDQYKIKNSKKVVSIFDTSYIEVEKHYSTYDEAQCFLKDVIELAKSMPKCVFLFKPSKDDAYFLEGYWSDKKGDEVVQLRRKFEQLENTTMLLDSDDVIDVISVSDVVFTNSFSSPTTDALLANIPAFWYQAKTDVSFSIYNKVPNLVVNGHSNLITQVNKMLQDNNPIDFSNNLNFLYLIGDKDEKPLTSLRLNFANA
jgi:hypothetical protein